jgi:hypothetical protein
MRSADGMLSSGGRRAGPGRSRPIIGMLVAVLLPALFVVAGSAQAAPKSLNGFVGGQSGVGAGGFFTGPSDIAVYTGLDADPDNDKIFVVSGADDTDSRVQRVDADANFELAWGKDVIAEGPGDTGVGYEICVVAERCQGGDKGTSGGELDDPMGVAVNQTSGHVYVMDRDNRRVQEFDLDGSFVRAWGWNVIRAGESGDTGAGFEVCTTASSCQAGASGTGGGQFGSSSSFVGIAVSPVVPHDVFVADPANRRVQQFSATGGFVRAWGWNVDSATDQFQVCTTASVCQDGSATTGPENGRFAAGEPRHLAVDADGIVYASDGTSGNRVIRFDADLAPASGDASAALLEPLPAPGLLVDARTVGLEVDSSTGNLLVGRYSGGPDDPVVQEIADPGAPVSGGPPNPTLVDTHVFATESPINAPVIRSIGFNPGDGNIYVAAFPLYGPSDGIFTGCLDPDDPSAGTQCHGLIVLANSTGPVQAFADPPSDVGATTAEISASVNPGGGVASYNVEVSRDGNVWTDATGKRYASGSSIETASVHVSGLEPNTLYRLRVRASKQVGMDEIESVVSSEQILLTDALAPEAQTLGSANRTTTGAQLRGRINPNNASTSYRFEYGLAGDSFDRHVPIPDGSAGSGGSPQLFVQSVSGLLPDTLYQYRIVATNFVGTTVGDVVTFRTKAPVDFPEPEGRAYELVSPAEKVGGQGAGSWYHSPSSQAEVGIGSYDGERFGVQGMLGSVLIDGDYAYATDWALAERTASGWVHSPAMNRRAFGRQSARFLNLAGANEDFSLMLWGSNAGLLRLFPELEEWDEPAVGNAIYVRDWEGNWEIAGPTAEAQASGSDALEGRALAQDGSAVVGSSVLRGLAGPGDPVLESVPGARNVLLDDVSAGLSNTFPGAGERSVVNVCTVGTVIPDRLPSGKLGAQGCQAPPPGRDARLIDSRGASIGAGSDRSLEHVISPSGDRVLFVSPDPEVGANNADCSGTGPSTACPPQLYVRHREPDGDILTRWISQSEVPDQDASLLAPTTFEGASRDGDKVFFRTAAPLTEDDPNGGSPVAGGVKAGDASPSSVDLYMYDFPDDPEADPATGDLVRVSAGPNGDGDGNVSNVTAGRSGAVRFLSDDGGRVYFTSAAPLPGVPASSNGTITSPDGTRSTTSATNLYLYDASQPVEQRWRFVARLPRLSTLGACATTNSTQDATLVPISQGPDMTFGTGNCVRGTTDGSFITFWTDGQLTLDDADAVTGDVYGYDATAEELTRISAAQGGAGGTYPCAPGGSSAPCYGDGGFGSYAIQRLGVATDPATPGERLAFFQSRSRLLPEDTDSAYDVYQWRNGELSLISVGGDDPDGAFYQGNDRSGRSVFFSTRDRMTWQDRDAVLDVYVARVGGGFPQPPGPIDCDFAGGGCQGGGAPKVGSQINTRAPQGGNPQGGRIALSVGSLSKRARARAARTGVVRLKVTVSKAASVSASARARIAGRSRKVAATREAAGAGTMTIALRLSKAAKRRLRSGKALRLSLSVKADGARAQAMGLTLKRPKKRSAR